MFLLKILGSFMIILSCTLMGFSFGNSYSKRYSNLIYLQNCIDILETEISYLATPIPEALENVYRKGNKKVSYIFRDISSFLSLKKDIGIYDSFLSIEEELKKNLHLRQEDIEVLLSLGRILGTSDRYDQQKHLKAILTQLRSQQRNAEEEKKKNEKMYKSLGVLTGLALVIILL